MYVLRCLLLTFPYLTICSAYNSANNPLKPSSAHCSLCSPDSNQNSPYTSFINNNNHESNSYRDQQRPNQPQFQAPNSESRDQNYGPSGGLSPNKNYKAATGNYGQASNSMLNSKQHPKSTGYLTTEGRFSENVLFGAATSAYQVEGAWNVDGRGPSIWDEFVHRVPSVIRNNDTGDVAVNSYFRYKEDVRLAAQIGLKVYRFSISWSRVLPTGYCNILNIKGLQYYKNLVREIRKYNMIPAATIYHFDLPYRLFQDGHHWTNVTLIPHFVNYARIVIENLPEVGYWFTINEPKQICLGGYSTKLFPPAIESSGLLDYQCSYITLKAHAAVYHMYKREFPHYTAKMSIIADCAWIEPFSDSPVDESAAERQRQFECGLYYNPIYNGDWPEVVKNRIRDRSFAAGFTKSRLPQFTREEIEYIKGTADFLAVNHYYTQIAQDVVEAPLNETSYNADLGVADSFDPSWKVESNGIFVSVPFGARKVLKWLTDRYGHQQIMITEIGMSDNGTYTNDTDRVDFFADYFCNILQAVDEGVDLMGIIYWSLIDNFEWPFGYSVHFGLYYIDNKDPQLRRIPKTSTAFVKELSRTRKLKCDKPRRNWPRPIRLPGFKKQKESRPGYFNLPRPQLLPNMLEIVNRFYSDVD